MLKIVLNIELFFFFSFLEIVWGGGRITLAIFLAVQTESVDSSIALWPIAIGT